MISTANISTSVNFDLPGKTIGSLDLKHSDNLHAFDSIPIPIAIINNGQGPTLLLSAGNHGDEYEGQVILRRLIHDTSPENIKGRLIILPALNYPAMMDNARVSPLDQGNLNRSFPGEEFGGPTEAIAHFVTSKLLPLCDAGVDLHSGGTQTYYLPSGFLCTCEDKNIMRQSLALIDVFNAPHTFVVNGAGSQSGFDPIAHGMGVPFISAELAGGANIDGRAVEVGMSGIRNILAHLGIQEQQDEVKPKTQFLNGIDDCQFVTAPYSGIFEPNFQLGDQVEAGQIAGTLYSTEEVERPPLELLFRNTGIVMVRRNGARVKRGSHVALVAGGISRDEIIEMID